MSFLFFLISFRSNIIKLELATSCPVLLNLISPQAAAPVALAHTDTNKYHIILTHTHTYTGRENVHSAHRRTRIWGQGKVRFEAPRD